MLTALVVAGVLQAGLTPVSARDLVWLDGVELETVGVVTADSADLFFPGGRYLHVGRARVEGIWRVDDGRFCRRTGIRHSVERCFAVFSDGQGRLYRTPSFVRAGTVVEEIRFVPRMTGDR